MSIGRAWATGGNEQWAVMRPTRPPLKKDAQKRVAPKQRDVSSLHSVERFLENLLIVSTAEFFAAAVDPFFFERVLGGTIGFVEDAEDAGERQLRQFVGGE